MYISDKKERRCLKCSKMFMSNGIGNRICSKCTASNASIRMGTRPVNNNPVVCKIVREEDETVHFLI